MTTAVHSELDPRVVAFVSSPKKMLIDGQWVDAASGRRFDTVDPATEAVITTVPHGGVEDVERAVRAGRRAFDEGPWPSLTPAERQRLLWRIGEGILARADQFAQLEALDNGKSVAVARAVPASATVHARWPAVAATAIRGSTSSRAFWLTCDQTSVSTARKSSGPSPSQSRSTANRACGRPPTTPRTAWPPACGPATCRRP